MGTPLGPKYIPNTYMDPLGMQKNFLVNLEDPPDIFQRTSRSTPI